MSKNLMIIAGEVSGDMHAGRIIAALKKKQPDIVCWGIGGDELRAQDVELLYDVKDMAVMGLTEVLRRYFFFRRVFNRMLKEVQQRKPDAVLLIDYPGFNLRIADRLHNMGIKVLYYVCPQVWAWHQSRIPKMAEIIDRLMVIFPFEVDVFKGTGLQVDFVGHPLVEVACDVRKEQPMTLPWGTGKRIALLPGSRHHEIKRILPDMLETATLLKQSKSNISYIIAAPSEKVLETIRQVINEQRVERGNQPDFQVVKGATRQVLAQADAAMVASGTATIETALQQCPMIIVYRTSPLTYFLAKHLVKGVENIGMVNIVAEKTICREYIQQDVKPAKMAQEIGKIITDHNYETKMKEELKKVSGLLGKPGCEKRVADIIDKEL